MGFSADADGEGAVGIELTKSNLLAEGYPACLDSGGSGVT